MRLTEYPKLQFYSTWKECSKDSSCNEYMLESENRVIDFDRVKTEYLNQINKSEECAASVDALSQDSNDHVYMVEFKNGEIDSKNIRNKITDSLLIYGDIVGKTINQICNNTTFILVYNADRIDYPPQIKRAIHQSRLGKTACPLYDLDKYQGLYFTNAYMMSKELFAKKMVDKMC